MSGRKVIEQPWARAGIFMVQNDQPVRCGICCESYESANAKAKHLQGAHGAHIRVHVRPDGLAEYHWRRL